MSRPVSIIEPGTKYGALKVTGFKGVENHRAIYNVRCVYCGRESEVRGYFLKAEKVNGMRCPGCKVKPISKVKPSSVIGSTKGGRHNSKPAVPAYVPEHEGDF